MKEARTKWESHPGVLILYNTNTDRVLAKIVAEANGEIFGAFVGEVKIGTFRTIEAATREIESKQAQAAIDWETLRGPME